jgi:hypothetical protein
VYDCESRYDSIMNGISQQLSGMTDAEQNRKKLKVIIYNFHNYTL